MDEPQIELVGVTRTFEVRRREGLRRRTRPVTALDDVSLAVDGGEAVGLIGAAGAGKSTVLGIIAGALAPTVGHVRTDGLPAARRREELAGRIGVVLAGRPQLLPGLSLAESLSVLATIHRLVPGRWQLRQDELVEHLDLDGHLATPIGRLPPGLRFRAELAAALLHEPVLLLLDEPGAGLDVASRERMRSCVRRAEPGPWPDGPAGQPAPERRAAALRPGARARPGPARLRRDAARTDRAGRRRRVLVVDLAAPGEPLDGVTGTEVVEVEAGGLRQRLAFTSGATDAARVLAEIAARAEVRHVTLAEPDVADLMPGRGA